MTEYNDGTGQWHSETMARFSGLNDDALIHILRDCNAAVHAMPDNPKCPQYFDEMLYCGMELKKRGYKYLITDKDAGAQYQ